MSQRIFNSCKRHFCNGSYSKNDLLNLADNIAKETALVDKIRTEANLEIANLTVANQFCIAKVPTPSFVWVIHPSIFRSSHS